MAGPWEKYADAPAEPSSGPWEKYQASVAPAKQESSIVGDIAQGAGNLAAGAVRGAGSIGATLLAPFDIAKDALAGKGLTLESNNQRRADIDAGLQLMGAQPDSWMYKGGKLAGEIAGTAGVGGVAANGVRAVAPAAVAASPRLAQLASAIESGGLTANGGNMLTRIAGGAISGGLTAAAIDPSDAGTGAVLGGALPVAAKAGGMAGQYIADLRETAAKKLMQSALKPTLKQLQTGDAQVAVDTLLANGINPTAGGVSKLRTLIDDIDSQISDKISNSTATVSKNKAIDTLWDTRAGFAKQVDPTTDLNAIDALAERFYLDPRVKGDEIPVQLAQELKQGTYKVLAKKYGQMGSAEVEGQKALARSLKEQIADAVPEVSGLNADLSNLLTTLKVSERRALMELNKNPMGLAALAHDPKSWAMFMADKSALFKSLAARMVNPSGNPSQLQMLSNPNVARLLPGAITAIRGEASP